MLSKHVCISAHTRFCVTNCNSVSGRSKFSFGDNHGCIIFLRDGWKKQQRVNRWLLYCIKYFKWLLTYLKNDFGWSPIASSINGRDSNAEISTCLKAIHGKDILCTTDFTFWVYKRPIDCSVHIHTVDNVRLSVSDVKREWSLPRNQ